MELSSLFLAGKGSALTSFFSTAFLVVFLPFCLVVYSLMPRRGKKYFLLAADCAFFWLISGKLHVYLLLTALSMHYFGLWLDKIQSETKLLLAQTEKAERKTVRKRQQAVQHRILLLAVILHIGVLFALKYSGFAATNVNTLLAHLHIPVQLAIPKYVMPIGISFFTLQALSYIVDVQRGVTKADTNLLRLTLFISFFPQIVEGPICRYDQTAQQLWDAKPITYENLTLGLQRIAYGMMKKVIIADRLNPLVRNVFNNYTDFDGGVIALAAVCYTVQLYMDFSGSMDAVTGTAQILGVTMPENFRQPFFSKTISEFWKRWHITLGTWFKDYVFYPVVTLKPLEKLTSAARKRLGNHYGPLLASAVALFCVWFCNGLWHGAAWSYLFFGMYHFVLILGGNIIAPPVRAVNARLHIRAESFPYRLLQMLRTTVLVIIGELFFRANGLRAGMQMFRTMVTGFAFPVFDDALFKALGIDKFDLMIVAVTLLIVFVVSVINEKGKSVRALLAQRPAAVRWTVFYALILFIIVFGAYGKGYIPVDPMYANF